MQQTKLSKMDESNQNTTEAARQDIFVASIEKKLKE